MRVVMEYYFDDLEQRCTEEGCGYVVGPYSEEERDCPFYHNKLRFFRSFGTQEQRSKPVNRWEARISGLDY